ncbi:hypothetical protein GYMLUDRAFT_47135 [Collybiopsis luxurians FD-317 M1]|uniref:F-box domain-containing protein n=1 Tax=Collybiopsis luxurians FD-317 M1 TaxID=944289 RepID=A0A0D0B018_9AGAR|nr:hypothetical protein GYMLUDRAFT_47135 [Collybiopsis luxurians FD-317 M1]
MRRLSRTFAKIWRRLTRIRRTRSTTDYTSLIPPELLADIFLYLSPNSILYPPKFTQVCSRWRSIAHSSPALWNVLKISFPSALKTKIGAASFKLIIAEWVSRSSSLNVDLIVHEAWAIKGRSKFRRALYDGLCKSVIMDFSTKWRLLNLAHFWEGHDFFSHDLPLPNLEELTINVHRYNICPDLSLTQAPHLRKLNFYSEHSPTFSCLQKFIPTTAVELGLRGTSCYYGVTDDFIRGFFHCSQLQYLSRLEIDQGSSWFDTHVLPSTCFPTLLSLTVRGSCYFLGDLLGVLTLPLLRQLFVTISCHRRERYPGPIVGFILIELQKRSHFPLSLLSLNSVLEQDDWPPAMTWSDFSSFLSTCSSIQELRVGSTGKENAGCLMDILRYDSSETILPRLKVFSLRGVSDFENHFVEFIRSRWWPENPQETLVGAERLEKLTFIGCKLRRETRELLMECYRSVVEQYYMYESRQDAFILTAEIPGKSR